MTAIRDFLMKMEGMEVNVDERPTAKQWAAIVQWIAELKTASEAPIVIATPFTSSIVSTPQTTTAPPMTSNGDATDILAQVNAIKNAGKAGQVFSGAAMDAGPPPAARRK